MKRLKSYAKVNLALRVFALRQGEALHRIDSVLTLYRKLYDTVEIEPAVADQVTFVGMKISGLDTVSKALCAFRSATGITEHYRVVVTKRIPIGAGLGGGSSNAGTVLRYLAGRHGVSDRTLVRVAMAVGSDVPFFALGFEQARITGFGATAVPVRSVWRVKDVVLSPVVSITGKVYERFDRLGERRPVKNTIGAFLRAEAMPFNDLERAYLHLHPGAAARLEQLRQDGNCAVVSGSGSAIAILIAKDRRTTIY